MKSAVIISALVLMLVCSNCKKDNSNTEDLDTFSIIFQKNSAWVDYSYIAVINQAGLLQVVETNGLTNTTESSAYQLKEKDMLLIRNKLSDLAAIDIDDRYGFDAENSPTDLPATKLIYKTNAKSDTSVIYYPRQNEMPVQFDAFMQTIVQVLVENDSLIDK